MSKLYKITEMVKSVNSKEFDVNNEAYFGDKNTLKLKSIQFVNELRKIFIEKKSTIKKDLTAKLREFELIMSKEMNLDKFNITLHPDKDFENMASSYTTIFIQDTNYNKALKMYQKLKDKKMVQLNSKKDGIVFSDEAKNIRLLINLGTSLFLTKMKNGNFLFTDAEIAAVMFHEIGHSVDMMVYDFEFTYKDLLKSNTYDIFYRTIYSQSQQIVAAKKMEEIKSGKKYDKPIKYSAKESISPMIKFIEKNKNKNIKTVEKDLTQGLSVHMSEDIDPKDPNDNIFKKVRNFINYVKKYISGASAYFSSALSLFFINIFDPAYSNSKKLNKKVDNADVEELINSNDKYLKQIIKEIKKDLKENIGIKTTENIDDSISEHKKKNINDLNEIIFEDKYKVDTNYFLYPFKFMFGFLTYGFYGFLYSYYLFGIVTIRSAIDIAIYNDFRIENNTPDIIINKETGWRYKDKKGYMDSKKRENFADHFAFAYGFSEETASFLTKFNKFDRNNAVYDVLLGVRLDLLVKEPGTDKDIGEGIMFLANLIHSLPVIKDITTIAYNNQSKLVNDVYGYESKTEGRLANIAKTINSTLKDPNVSKEEKVILKKKLLVIEKEYKKLKTDPNIQGYVAAFVNHCTSPSLDLLSENSQYDFEGGLLKDIEKFDKVLDVNDDRNKMKKDVEKLVSKNRK